MTKNHNAISKSSVMLMFGFFLGLSIGWLLKTDFSNFERTKGTYEKCTIENNKYKMICESDNYVVSLYEEKFVYGFDDFFGCTVFEFADDEKVKLRYVYNAEFTFPICGN